MDSFGEVILPLEFFGVARVVALHLALLPNTEGVRSVDMRNVQDIADMLAAHSGVPIVAVEELVLERVPLDEPECILAPLGDPLAQVLLRDELPSTTRYSNDTYLTGNRFNLRLVVKSSGPDVHFVAELRQFLRKFQHVHHLAPGVGRPQGGWAAT